jgi:hypothetical protein
VYDLLIALRALVRLITDGISGSYFLFAYSGERAVESIHVVGGAVGRAD